jgi:hypothetical protein
LVVSAAPDGSVLVAENGHCSSTLKRLDLTTGRERLIRTIPEAVSGMVVNPSGTKIAYVAQLRCGYTCPGVCAGLAGFLPSVLVVSDLTTGRSIRTSTDQAGHPLMSLAWSPDGTQIVAAYWGDNQQLLRFSAAAPNFAKARRLAARLGCHYVAATWTRIGIIAAEACGSESFSSGRLVEATTTGVVKAAWPLPDCINGVSLVSTPDGAHTLVGAGIGYGSGACRTHGIHRDNPISHIAMVDGARLRTVVDLNDDLAVDLAGY